MSDKELRADLEELRRLEGQANRANVKNVIRQEIARLEDSLRIIEEKVKAHQHHQETNSESEKGGLTMESPTEKLYDEVKSYSFDQTDEFVKVYIILDGVKASGAQVTSHFTKRSFDVKITGYKGKDLRLQIPHLHASIDESKSKVITNNNNVTIKLAKAKGGSKWSDLKFKEGAIKEDDIGKEKDPNASMMDMMKKMYEEGDDNTKRSIAEAWTKSREGKNPEAGGMGGMPGMGGMGGMPGMGGMGGMGGMEDDEGDEGMGGMGGMADMMKMMGGMGGMGGQGGQGGQGGKPDMAEMMKMMGGLGGMGGGQGGQGGKGGKPDMAELMKMMGGMGGQGGQGGKGGKPDMAEMMKMMGGRGGMGGKGGPGGKGGMMG
jgi:calcyclin binding protein